MQILRTIYLVLPSLLAFLSFVFTLLVVLGQLSASSSLLQSLYFIRFTTSTDSLANTVSSLLDASQQYSIGLWNYCHGPPTVCSAAQAAFHFDPLEAWGLDNTAVAGLVPADWDSALSTYAAASKWMFIAYIVALCLSGVTVLMGAMACCMSRGAACCTFLVAGLSALFSVGASATATAIFTIVRGVVADKLGNYGVQGDLGNKMLAYSWVGSAFALLAAAAWMFGCCCAGDRDSSSKRTAFRVKDDYERVPEPYMGHGALQMQPQAPVGQQQGWYGKAASHNDAAFEPYRREHV